MINIICFGNSLFADDGVGEEVFRQLESELKAEPDLEGFVCLFYAGNSGQRAFPYFFNCSHLIVVDAIKSQETDSNKPGQVYCLSENELSELEENDFGENLSSHQLSLLQSWTLLKACRSELPQFTLFAIEVGHVTPYTVGLNDEAESSAQQVVAQILKICHSQPKL